MNAVERIGLKSIADTEKFLEVHERRGAGLARFEGRDVADALMLAIIIVSVCGALFAGCGS